MDRHGTAQGENLVRKCEIRKRVFTLESVLRLAVDIAKGMVFIHSRNVTHGDLKSSNILLSGSGLVAKSLTLERVPLWMR